ncbi:MAG: glycosyltransferase family 39 protein [Acidobacteria bacterium]|nr:glycosyltransferase family 39 protein [Acidobacteriota bacterium]
MLILLLAIQTAAIAYQVRAVGLTVDEPSHMLSAYLYWRGEDNLKPGDMPPFIKLLGGWPAILLKPPLPVSSPSWKTGHEWNISAEMLNSMRPPELHRWIHSSRAPFVLISPLITLLLWYWARQLWDPQTALVLAALWVVEPTALGHGGLFKNDVSATLGYLAFWYTGWRFWRSPDWRNALWVSLALSLAVLTKMSMLVLLPLAPVLLAIGALRKRRWPEVLLLPAGSLSIAYGICSAACQFQMRHLLYEESQTLLLPSQARLLLLPSRYVDGALSLLFENSNLTLVYLLGRIHPGGSYLYFLVGLLFKSPLPFLLLLVAAIGLAARPRFFTTQRLTLFFLLFPPVLYFALASVSALQLGYRLVLPGIPFLILLCGLPVSLAFRSGRAWIPLSALVLAALSTISQYPYTISYFNCLSPHFQDRLQRLSDSNIDWGHGLPALRQWCLDHQVRRIRLCFFGNDPPHRHFPDEENMVELIAPPWNDELARGPELRPEPGVWAVSATLLTGQFFDLKYRNYYRVFKERQPDDVVAGSILIYRIPER